MFSIIIPTKGRLGHLKKTIKRSIVQEHAETIVVDYDCPQASGAWVREACSEAIVVSVNSQPRFSIARARNLGAAVASHRWLVFLDVDIELREGFFECLSKIVQPGHFYFPKVRDHGFAGFIVVEQEFFRRVGGYDPSYEGFGIEDDDLIMALTKAGGIGLTMDSFWIGKHLSHGDESRIAFYSQSKLSESLEKNTAHFLEKWGQPVRRAIHRRKWQQVDTAEMWAPASPQPFPSHRLGMIRLHPPEEDAFNGSLISTDEGTLLVYRAPPGCACIFLNDASVGIAGTHQQLNLWRNDDPRLFYANGCLYLSTSYHGNGFRNERVELRRVQISQRQVTTEVVGKFDWIEGDPDYKRIREKNWAPFEHDGRILYVHKAQPHRILEVDVTSGTARLIHQTQWMLPKCWQSSWGHELRLNSPPFRLSDGRYISTLHTRHGLSYRTWFYTFSAAPPFRVESISSAPVLLPGDAIGLNTRNRRHRCIFITGMQVFENSDSIILSGGNNDTSVVTIPFRLSAVLGNLVPVRDLSEPTFVRSSDEMPGRRITFA